MPNWTQNTIRIGGEPADIRAFLEAVKWEDELFDFNRLIPMPNIVRNTASGGRTFDGVHHDAWYAEYAAHAFGPQNERAFTPEERAALQEIGHTNWYSWSVDNWGTKWNACETHITDATIDNGHVEIRFDTAWSVPMPVLENVFEMFPQLAISWAWADEDDGYTQRHAIERGAIKADDEVAA